jgi:hypothetical protein
VTISGNKTAPETGRSVRYRSLGPRGSLGHHEICSEILAEPSLLPAVLAKVLVDPKDARDLRYHRAVPSLVLVDSSMDPAVPSSELVEPSVPALNSNLKYRLPAWTPALQTNSPTGHETLSSVGVPFRGQALALAALAAPACCYLPALTAVRLAIRRPFRRRAVTPSYLSHVV